MRTKMLRGRRASYVAPLLGGGLLLAATALLLPDRWQIADAIRRAAFVSPAPAVMLPAPSTAQLMHRFTEGKPISVPDLKRLMSASLRTASPQLLSAMAERIRNAGADVSTQQTSYDIRASGRPDAALAFLESRPDGRAPALWRLRFDLHRQLGDDAGAADLLRAAAIAAGSAPAKDIVEASYALARPDMIVVAAEHGSIPPLSRSQALDLASWANGSKRYDLIGRIDRAGTPAWRADNPWLAMTLARQAGDTRSALRYAALLPTGSDAARESIVMATGDREAIRRLLLDQAASGRMTRPAAAQQLLEKGFRADAIDLLRQQSVGRATDDAIVTRTLYLMGPRPAPQDLTWLRSRASSNPKWLPVYLEREQPGRALAFLEARPDAGDTEMLLNRVRLANAARDDAASARALDGLLDGRPLNGPQLKVAASALTSSDLSSRYALPLVRARIRAGEELASDRMDLAWAAWNKGDARGTIDQLRPYLVDRPNDRQALLLMASAQGKVSGVEGERPWLKRLLDLAPALSRERADLLGRLGRTSDAIALLETLRRESPGDRLLDIQLARLLIAAGDPGRARKVLRP